MFKKIIAVALLTTNVWAAGGGTDVGGGGESTKNPVNPVLRDVVDPSTCTWVQGSEFLDELTHLPESLKSLDLVHWYLGLSLVREIQTFNICKTDADLRAVPTEDYDTVTEYDFEGAQAAVRDGTNVYIDMKIFRQMNSRSKTYLLLHEAMHSFVAMDAKQRNSKIRSMVRTIFKNEDKIISRSAFSYQVEMNELEIASYRMRADGYCRKGCIDDSIKPLVLGVLGYPEPRDDEAKWLTAYHLRSKSPGFLSERDQAAVSQIAAKIDNDFSNAIVRDDVDRFNELSLKTGDNGPWKHPSHLVKYKLYRDYSNESGITSLSVAAGCGSTKILELLLNNLSPDSVNSSRVPTISRTTLLMWAVINGKLETARFLLSRPQIEINAKTEATYTHGSYSGRAELTGFTGATALSMAAALKDAPMVELLLEHGADPNIQDERGRHALLWAVSRISMTDMSGSEQLEQEKATDDMLATLRVLAADPRVDMNLNVSGEFNFYSAYDAVWNGGHGTERKAFSAIFEVLERMSPEAIRILVSRPDLDLTSKALYDTYRAVVTPREAVALYLKGCAELKESEAVKNRCLQKFTEIKQILEQEEKKRTPTSPKPQPNLPKRRGN